MRIYFVGGKGGVGKTTVAGVLGLILNERGRTLLISTDPAHSLGDFFSIKDKEKFKVGDLFVSQPDAETLLRKRTSEIEKEFFRQFSPTLREDFSPFFRYLSQDPSNIDLVMLEVVKKETLSGNWDFLVVDSGPTAQVLKFFFLAEKLLDWYSLLKKWRKKYLKLREMIKGKSQDKMLEVLKNRIEEQIKFRDTLLSCKLIWVLEPTSLSIRETIRALPRIKAKEKYLVINKVRGDYNLSENLKGYKRLEIPLFDEEPVYMSSAMGEIKQIMSQIM